MALLVVAAWPLSAALGQSLAQSRKRDADFWLFACALGGPAALLLLRLLPLGDGKTKRRRLADRIVAVVAVLFLVGLLALNMLRACLGV
ncbi:MAG: hypothetical protein JXR83_19810 [Deltaproteobacteria bacterium]|nr:hypothetical protein [Deltaproteobacteria bacterium]